MEHPLRTFSISLQLRWQILAVSLNAELIELSIRIAAQDFRHFLPTILESTQAS
jgi:hypothetical protein